jgi:hypothetical protein
MKEQGLETKSSGNKSKTIPTYPYCVPQPRPGKLNVMSQMGKGLKESLSGLLIGFLHTHTHKDSMISCKNIYYL